MQTREPHASQQPLDLSQVRLVTHKGEDYYLGVDIARVLSRETFNLYRTCERKGIKTVIVHCQELKFQQPVSTHLPWRSGGRKLIHKGEMDRLLSTSYFKKKRKAMPLSRHKSTVEPRPYSLWCCEEFVALVTAATATTGSSTYPWTADKLSTPVWAFTDWSHRRINRS